MTCSQCTAAGATIPARWASCTNSARDATPIFSITPRPMNLDGLLHGAQVRGDLLVQLSGDDVLEHLALAGREGVEALLDALQFPPFRPRDAVLFDRRLDCLDQVPFVGGLGEKIAGAALHRPYTRRHVAVARKEDDGRRAPAVGERRCNSSPSRSGIDRSRSRQPVTPAS